MLEREGMQPWYHLIEALKELSSMGYQEVATSSITHQVASQQQFTPSHKGR